MKLLSFAIPCYNSAAYMEKCIKSCLAGGDDVEIIIVDDGSTKDDTLKIAKEYEAKYPNIVKAVHQENGGHGEAVNTGLKHATGRFFKVVDSDDWVNEYAYGETSDYDKVTLEDDEYFILGDNRLISKDSRYFGPIKENEIKGKIVFRLFPFIKIGMVQ